jgi:probable dihydroxyacetone kinase regulator
MRRPCRIRGRVCCSFAMCAVYWRQQHRKGGGAMRESATKKVLAESLKELMLRRDFADITVTDLCAAAEINRRTFYRHFTDKYQLVTWIYDRGFQKAIGDDEPGLFDLFVRVCTYLYADRAFYARALTFTGQNSFHDFLCARLRPYLQADFSDLFPDPQTEAFMSGKMSDVVMDIIQNWLSRPDCPPPEVFAPWALHLWKDIMGRWKELGDAWEHTSDHKNA